jgi:hypothetical protein
VISVDTKKKELVGDFKNAGRELRPKGQPQPVRVHDFAIPELGKAVPYCIYDVSANAGFVNVGISADTGEFSVASIRRWWCEIGAPRYPSAKQLLINADCGGSNGARLRLWKRELQVLADELGIEITVCHVAARHHQVEQDRCVTNTSSEKGGEELYERWGQAPRDRQSGAGLKPLQAAVVKSNGGERCSKRRDQIPSGMVWRGEREQTVDEVSKFHRRCQNRGCYLLPGSARGWP